MKSMANWIRKQPVVAMYILTLFITWLGWVPQALYSRGLFPFNSIIFYILGGTGPLLAVFIVRSTLRGGDPAREIFHPFLRWRVSLVWYLVALFLYPALWILISLWRGDLAFELTSLGSAAGVAQVFIISLIAAIPEEVAWRGFALPRLQARTSALAAGLITGVMAAVWHLPLLFIEGTVMASYPLLPYLLFVVLLSLLYAWVYNNTGGSLLLLVLFHAATNSVGHFAGWEQTLVFALAAGAVVAIFGPNHLSRQNPRPVEYDVSPVSTMN